MLLGSIVSLLKSERATSLDGTLCTSVEAPPGVTVRTEESPPPPWNLSQWMAGRNPQHPISINVISGDCHLRRSKSICSRPWMMPRWEWTFSWSIFVYIFSFILHLLTMRRWQQGGGGWVSNERKEEHCPCHRQRNSANFHWTHPREDNKASAL